MSKFIEVTVTQIGKPTFQMPRPDAGASPRLPLHGRGGHAFSGHATLFSCKHRVPASLQVTQQCQGSDRDVPNIANMILKLG